MIRINLLSEKKKKAISVPIGGIVVVLWVLINLGGLYQGIEMIAQEKEQYIEEKQISRLEREVARMKGDLRKMRKMKQELNNVEQALSDYQGILSKRMGSWTRVLHRFEDFVARAKTIWLTQLRIDPEGQVQLNGLSMETETNQRNSENKKIKLVTQGVTDFVTILQQETDFVRSVNLSQVNHDFVDKMKVAKFDLTFVIDRN